MPPVSVIGSDGTPEIVNYRTYRNVVIVDRLFAAAELRLGGDTQQKVRIVRSDGSSSGLAPKRAVAAVMIPTGREDV